MSDVTHLLDAIQRGDALASEQLVPLVYDELRRLAAQKLAHEAPGHSLQATALVHEAYVRLVDSEPAPTWQNRGHFFAAAAEAMRRILVEHARRRRRLRHGGDRKRVPLDKIDAAELPERDDHLLALDEALAALAREDAVVAQVVKLRYFAGLTIEQTAEALELSVRTANRHFAYAKAWLFEALSEKS